MIEGKDLTPFNALSLIFPGLWASDEESLTVEACKRNGIGMVCRVDGGSHPHNYLVDNHIIALSWDVLNMSDGLRKLKETLTFVWGHRSQDNLKNGVAIYCEDGGFRTGLACAAVLMSWTCCDFSMACWHVADVRPMSCVFDMEDASSEECTLAAEWRATQLNCDIGATLKDQPGFIAARLPHVLPLSRFQSLIDDFKNNPQELNKRIKLVHDRRELPYYAFNADAAEREGPTAHTSAYPPSH